MPMKGDTVLLEQRISTYSGRGINLNKGFYKGTLHETTSRAFIGLRQCQFVTHEKPDNCKGLSMQFEFRFSMVEIWPTRMVLFEKYKSKGI